MDPPLTPGVVRAHGNWVARLAARCTLAQKNLGSQTFILPQRAACLRCLSKCQNRLDSTRDGDIEDRYIMDRPKEESSVMNDFDEEKGNDEDCTDDDDDDEDQYQEHKTLILID